MEGVSPRKAKEVTEELCGTTFSKSLISSLALSTQSFQRGGSAGSKQRLIPTCLWTPATRRCGWTLGW